MKKLSIGAVFSSILAVVVMTMVPLSGAMADISVLSATLDGGSTTTVAPTDSVDVDITVARSGPGASNDWKATSWNIIGDGILGDTCVNTTDHDGGGSPNAESFSIPAPNSAGTYDVVIKIYRSDFLGFCISERDSVNLEDGITVAEASATLTVTKVVTNDNGGEAVVGDFTLLVGETEVTSGESNEFDAGSYVVSEVGPTGYSPTFSGDCDENGNIEMDSDESYVCTITNNDKPGHLLVHKVTLPASDDFTEFTITASGDGAIDGDAEQVIMGGGTVDYTVDAGTYSVSEEEIDGNESGPGWNITDNTCEDVEVGIGETEECTITNTQRVSFKLTKLTDPAELSFDFEFSGGPGEQENVPASIDNLGNEESWEIFDILPGEYSIMELDSSLPEGWTGLQMAACSAAGDNDPEGSVAEDEEGLDVTLNPGDRMECTVNNTQDGVVMGQKFEDMDGDGEGNTGTGLSGWTIEFTLQDNPDTEIVEEGSHQEVTNESGNYSALLQPGTYRVCELPQEGWYQSYPTSEVENAVECTVGSGYLIVVEAASNTNGIDFGNYRTGTIAGTKWNDVNGDGLIDGDENGLSGFTIELLRDGYVEPETQVTVGGTYMFEGVHPGEYTIREVQQSGWAQTFPASNGSHSVTAVSGGIVINRNFGNTEDATISGMKFEDENANGVKDGEEGGLEGWTIYVDLNDDGTLDEGEPYAITNGDGEYTIESLLNGTYVVREEQQSGWGQTFPAEGSHSVTLGLNDDATEVNFGNADAATIGGMKWGDENADGYFDDESEDSLSGWTIVATPVTEEGEVDETRSEKETVTGIDGSYSFDFLPTEFGSWRVSEVQQEGWSQTYPNLPAYHEVFIDSPEVGYDSLDFGNWQSPIVTVMKWNDDDSSGSQNHELDVALEGWPMALGRVIEGESPSSTYIEIVDTDLTDSQGFAHLFAPADSGDYVVLEGSRSNWNMTYPASRPENLVVTFAPGVDPIDLDISSFFDVEISLYDDGETIDEGYIPSDDEEEEYDYMEVDLEFGNHETPSTGGGTDTGGGDGSNGLGQTDDNGISDGEVLGASTSTDSGSVLGSVCELPLTSYLRRGRANNAQNVMDLQNFLNEELDLNPPIPATGFFGPITEAAVKAFQIKYYDEVLKPWVDLGLLPANTATGIVYKMTLWKIQDIGCPSLNTPKPIIP